MKLRYTGFVDDMGYFDTEDKTVEVDVPEGSTIIEVVYAFFKNQERYTDEELEEFLDMVESGEWHGGEWLLLSDKALRYNTDVASTEYRI